MCTEKIQSFDNCDCSLRIIKVCRVHIKHTRQQKNDKLCPNLRGKRTILLNRGCGGEPCPAARKTIWLFETEEGRQLDFSEGWFSESELKEREEMVGPGQLIDGQPE
jgi:hypothetical protein